MSSPNKIVNQSALDDSKNIAVEIPTQMQISDLPQGVIDQSTTLSTTGINLPHNNQYDNSPEI